MRRIWILAAALGWVWTGDAFAQPNPIGSLRRPQTTNPYPSVSPYLGMFSGGGNAAINYFSIVRPNIDNAQDMSALQQSIFNLQAGAGAATSNNNDPNFGNQTGHPVAFQNYSHYFPLMYRTGGSVGSGLGARGVAQPSFSRVGLGATTPMTSTNTGFGGTGSGNFQTAPFFVLPAPTGGTR